MGLQDDINELRQLISEDKLKDQEKKFKFPFGKKVGKGQRRKNYVTILLLNENGVYDFKKYVIEDQTILHDTIPRIASAGHVMFDKKGNPLIILPNWSLEPFSPLDHYKASLTGGNNTTGFKLLMSKMENNKLGNKPKLGVGLKVIIGIILLGIIGYALITGGGA